MWHGFFPCHLNSSLVENCGKSHEIPTTFSSNSMEYPSKIHVILNGFDVTHPCHFPMTLTAFGHEFLFKKLHKKSPAKIRTLDLESETFSLSQYAIFERKGNYSLFILQSLVRLQIWINNNSNETWQISRRFSVWSNSKLNLCIIVHYKNRK